MRIRIAGTVTLAVVAASCQDPFSPQRVDASRPAFAVGAANHQTGPSNRCRSEIIAGIAATWPWAHDDKSGFAPPPGGIARWIQEFGPDVGVSSVRELQELFCSGGL